MNYTLTPRPPRNYVVEVALPASVCSLMGVELDVSATALVLTIHACATESAGEAPPPPLRVSLPRATDTEATRARFSRKKRSLTITCVAIDDGAAT